MITIRCSCGQKIFMTNRQKCLSHRMVFIDQETGQEIDYCPHCGEHKSEWLKFGEAIRVKKELLVNE